MLLTKLRGEPHLPTALFENRDLEAPLFVTWKKHPSQELRGCIGNFGKLNLGAGLRDYALVAALQDSRFSPVQLAEVGQLGVGVSLLVNFEESADAMDWEVGKHGIRISFKDPDDGRQRGATFLPEVATEQGWTKAETLAALCRKAGYRGPLRDDALLKHVKVVRYQSSKANLSFPEYTNL